MKYQDAKLRRMLAAEYVLGLLSSRARRRFEQLAAKDAALRGEQHFWESRLGRLGNAVPPVEPPETVWIGLSHHIGLIEPNKVVLLKKPAPPERGASPWRIGAGLAAAVAMVVVVIVSQRSGSVAPASTQLAQTPPPAAVVPQPTPAPTYVALLKIPDATLQWTVSIAPAHDRMSVATVGEAPALTAGHSIELWWLSPAGPVAIGVLPITGGGVMPLPKGMAEAAEMKLALSLEPVGGSPSGKPTGPVLTSAAAVKAA
jgi:anti-sigma-K factor RskA